MENVTTVENFEEAATTAAEMIEAGKDVLVDMSQEGKFNVSEIVKPSWFATYGPVAAFGTGCAIAGGLIGYGVSKLIKAHNEKKAAAEMNKQFADKDAKHADEAEPVTGEVIDGTEATDHSDVRADGATTK